MEKGAIWPLFGASSDSSWDAKACRPKGDEPFSESARRWEYVFCPERLFIDHPDRSSGLYCQPMSFIEVQIR
jgi:hypothetical protein